jgi:hypothetical protein
MHERVQVYNKTHSTEKQQQQQQTRMTTETDTEIGIHNKLETACNTFTMVRTPSLSFTNPHHSAHAQPNAAWFVFSFSPSPTSVFAGLTVASTSFLVLDRATLAATTVSCTAGHALVELAAVGTAYAAGATAGRTVRAAGNTAVCLGGATLQQASPVSSVIMATTLGLATVIVVSTVEAATTHALALLRGAHAAARRLPAIARATIHATPEIAEKFRRIALNASKTNTTSNANTTNTTKTNKNTETNDWELVEDE